MVLMQRRRAVAVLGWWGVAGAGMTQWGVVAEVEWLAAAGVELFGDATEVYPVLLPLSAGWPA